MTWRMRTMIVSCVCAVKLRDYQFAVFGVKLGLDAYAVPEVGIVPV